ncbi:redoxin domain-containing protein [Halobacterium bonnevillei]|uniref:Redoxin domain-containing protein n=1 Tax=Halobacterium bonnevillei TaxID=2692200 RepID=A0A6B0SKZ0_9EURY|nr:redoxin domain-containing protein [Halobacterium bonnevillei]MXR22315.1 redoxin domain-containing protein [Halobacterium bonnevillei]
MDLDFEVVDLPPADHVEAGDEAPDFTRPLVNDEFWEDVALSDLLADAPVLLVFTPMDGAFPSTYIWNELRDRGMDEYGVQVVGVSISTPYEHMTTIEERGIESFAGLFSDPQNGVAEKYGISHSLDGMAGVSEPRPSVFLVAPDGTVEYAWVADEWPAFPDYDAVEDAVIGL